ncbi:tRNA pseudouridine(38-40) synthase TruA [Filimonas effusa]|uniref:tRNA pseudouridine synthase A n=1 Tax=Filimonas effusa TaxID=2508721 RepID=A0A4Q1D165_9BACT|nr:tRNA pseudouridine(38-40) synthase TruA [Filimonas effusa]RXK81479.1 tRNA pseudouridine(38-40) synthase TruA [Filimonas effusa]
MPRYFLELAYKGTAYSGFQVQDNVVTVQSEVEKALQTVLRIPVALTGSSRTDAGVHALQNYFHFDFPHEIAPRLLYNINAVLPPDIVAKSLKQVADDAHSRFMATSREYRYHIYREKDPFLNDRAWFFPYKLELSLLNEAAGVLKEYKDFTSFSKRNTQVKTFICDIQYSQWHEHDNQLIYEVKANRFLRGMVRGLVATMVRVGRGSMTIDEFRGVIEAKDCSKADFAAPGAGLFLVRVNY